MSVRRFLWHSEHSAWLINNHKATSRMLLMKIRNTVGKQVSHERRSEYGIRKMS